MLSERQTYKISHGTLSSNVDDVKSMHNLVIVPGLTTSVYIQCFDPGCVKGGLIKSYQKLSVKCNKLKQS